MRTTCVSRSSRACCPGHDPQALYGSFWAFHPLAPAKTPKVKGSGAPHGRAVAGPESENESSGSARRNRRLWCSVKGDCASPDPSPSHAPGRGHCPGCAARRLPPHPTGDRGAARTRIEREARALGQSATIGAVRLTPWLSLEPRQVAPSRDLSQRDRVGTGLCGRRPAARHYSGKVPAELTPRQVAFLVSLIPGPHKYQRSFAGDTPLLARLHSPGRCARERQSSFPSFLEFP